MVVPAVEAVEVVALPFQEGADLPEQRLALV
jgi:hypothetical protein